MQLINSAILATTNTTGNTTARDAAANFFSEGIGDFISNVLVLLGFVVLIFAIAKIVMSTLKGNATGAIKNLVIGIALAGILFYPELLGSFVDWARGVWGFFATNADSITDANQVTQ